MAGEINKTKRAMPNGQQSMLKPNEKTVVQPDTRNQYSVAPHSRPVVQESLGEQVDAGPVIRSSRVAQFNAEQQARMAAASNSPVANNVQQVVDAAQVAPAGAVGNDSPIYQQANMFAKKYAPMLRGEQVKSAGEELLDKRTAKYQNQLMPEKPLENPLTKPIDPNSDTDGMNSILGNWTSKEDEEKYRKASVARQRIMAVADALRHIGNIYHTTRYAPSQKFNSPVEQERARYQQEKALRDQANQRIISYQQAKQKLDNEQKRWEAEQTYKRDKDARDFAFNVAKEKASQEEKKRQFDQTHELNKQKAENQRKYQEAQTELGKERNKIARGHLGVAWKNANTAADRVKIMKDYYQSGGRGGYRTGNGYNYATKNGYVTLKSDYLKNNINKESIVNQMKNSNFVDDEWKKQYEIAKWTNQDDEMLDEAISNWLMNDDNAESWMRDHFGDNGGVVAPNNYSQYEVSNGDYSQYIRKNK